MRKNNLFKTTAMTLAMLTMAVGMTACGNKNNTAKNTDTTAVQENATVADKNNSSNTKKTSKVVFDYTDADGNTSKLEGNATVNDNGEAIIEVVDNNGNKAVFIGKADTTNGKLSVSDIKVKDAGTLVKTDGTEVKVSEDAKIEDATESTEETKADVAAKDDTTDANAKEDVIVADNNVSEDTGNTDAGNDNGNVADTPSNEPVETPVVVETPEPVPEPEPTPEPVPTPEPAPAPTPNYIHCEAGSVLGFPAVDTTEEWAITWDTITPTSNKYIYYRVIGVRYDYFVFNEPLDTAVMLWCTTNPDVEEQTERYVKASKEDCPWIVH